MVRTRNIQEECAHLREPPLPDPCPRKPAQVKASRPSVHPSIHPSVGGQASRRGSCAGSWVLDSASSPGEQSGSLWPGLLFSGLSGLLSLALPCPSPADWDECADGSHDCSPAARCINLEGSYTCQCRTARDANPSRAGRACEGACPQPRSGTWGRGASSCKCLWKCFNFLLKSEERK